MSRQSSPDYFTQGTQTIPPQLAHAKDIARSLASYYYGSITFSIRREPSDHDSIVEVIQVYKSSRRPGFEYVNSPDVESFDLHRETIVRELQCSAQERAARRAKEKAARAFSSAEHNTLVSVSNTHNLFPMFADSAITSSPSFSTGPCGHASTATAAASLVAPNLSRANTSALPGGTRVDTASQTRAPQAPIPNTEPASDEDDIIYIKTVHPSHNANRCAGDSSARITSSPPHIPEARRQSKIHEYYPRQSANNSPRFSYKRLVEAAAGLPPNVVAGLLKSDLAAKALHDDVTELNKEIATLCDLNAEADEMLHALAARFGIVVPLDSPSSTTVKSPLGIDTSLPHVAGLSTAQLQAAQAPGSGASSSMGVAPIGSDPSPLPVEINNASSALPQDPVGSQNGSAATDAEYLTRRASNSIGKRRALSTSSRKRRGSSISGPPSKKARTV